MLDEEPNWIEKSKIDKGRLLSGRLTAAVDTRVIDFERDSHELSDIDYR